MFDRSHPHNLFTCSQDGGLWHWDVNSTSHDHLLQQAHTPASLLPGTRLEKHKVVVNGNSGLLAASEEVEPVMSSEYVSPWLSGAVGHGNPYIQDYSPSQGLPVAVNSLDIESRHLLCCTDREALFIVPNLTLR